MEAAVVPEWQILLAAIALAAAHLFVGALRMLERTPRSAWLSFAGGISVAYIFVHVLPEIGQAQRAVSDAAAGRFPFIEQHAYLVALGGLAVFYGLERAAVVSRQAHQDRAGQDHPTPAVFWVHLGSFAVYNGLVGYLLEHRVGRGETNLLVFFIAYLLHFLVVDFGLYEHYKHRYDHEARWILAAALLIGYAIGRGVAVSEATVGALFAFLAGGTILNVLKEELPEERESRFGAFAAGVAGYSALLILT